MSARLRDLFFFLMLPGLLGLASVPLDAASPAGAMSAEPPLVAGDWIDVDFREWSIEGPSSAWDFTNEGRSARRTDNGFATFLVGPEIERGLELEGTISIPTSVDDDWIGLTFAHQAPIAAEGTDAYDFDFVLFDWRKAPVSGAPEGTVLARIEHPIVSENTFGFAAAQRPGVEILSETRGPGTGWDSNASYEIYARYTPERITIRIDGVVVHDVVGQFPIGAVSIFNDSQQNAVYERFRFRQLLKNDLDASAGEDTSAAEGEVVSLAGAALALPAIELVEPGIARFEASRGVFRRVRARRGRPPEACHGLWRATSC